MGIRVRRGASASLIPWEGMNSLLPLRSVLSLSLAVLLLSACAASSPALSEWEGAEHDDAIACEDADADQCVVLACEEGECGIFGCEDVDPEAVARAPLNHGAELARGYRPSFRIPGTQRNWRRAGLRDGARPRMTFHFQYRHGYLPAFPRLEGRLIKHHLFPQQENLATWFKLQGINIHQWTMLIPEHAHLRIHRGARGGAWNAAWQQFVIANRHRHVPPEELLRTAFEFAFRFDIVGPLMPYSATVSPPGPQLFAP
jgi:uncharacterized lipoprotein (TIGR02269 family)